MTCVAEEKLYRSNEKSLAGDNYGYIDVQPSPNFTTPSPQCQCNNHPYHPPLPRQRMTANGPCCLHELTHNHSNMFGNYPTHNYHHQQANMGSDSMSHLPHMSHSRSLEHYSEPNHTMLPHRHSFDHQQQGCTAAVHHQHHVPQQRLHHSMLQQQQHPQYYRNAPQNYYDPTYDCIDENSVGGSSISYAAVAAAVSGAGTGRGVGGNIEMGCNSGLNYNINSSTYANPYNVSGNRIPIPYSISNQLSAYDNNSHHMGVDPAYARVMDNQMYAQVSKLPQNYLMNSANGGVGAESYPLGKSLENSNNVPTHRQNAYMSEQLIDFEDPPIIPPPPAAQFDPYTQRHDALRGRRYVEQNMPANYGPTTTRELPAVGKTTNTNGDMYVYAKPIPKECRQAQKNMQQSSMDKSSSVYLRKASYTSGERGAGDTTDLSYESANDDLSTAPRQHQQQQQHSPTQFTKNQDGVGSFESWNYVFKNLERSGYSKDLGEREDLLVKTLGLDSLNIANESTTPSQTSSVEKRRSGYKENDNPAQNIKQKTRVFEASEKANVGTTPPAANSNTKQKPQMDNNKQKIKSALKQPSTSGTSTTINKTNTNTNTNKRNSNLAKVNDNKSKGGGNNYVHDNNNIRALGNSKPNKKSSAATAQNSARKSSAGTAPVPASTQIIVTGANEWSCPFCTLINPDTTRICEMCCRTKDFILDAAPSASNSTASAAPQSSVAHNTPTCV